MEGTVESEATERRSLFSCGPAFRAWEWWWMLGLLAAYGIVSLWILKTGGPLGHDEAVYALRARDFRADVDPGLYWNDFRAPGLSWILQLSWIFRPSPPVLRFVIVGFGVGLVVLTWLIGRYMFGRRAGLAAAMGMAMTPVMLQSSTQVWPDIPGAALGLAAIALFLFGTDGDHPSRWIILAAPLIAGATIVRFGAPIPILVGLGVVAVWRWDRLWGRPGPVLAAGGLSLFAVFVILTDKGITGSAVAPLDAIRARPKDWFEGFGDYVQMAGDLIGTPAGMLLAVGLVAAVLLARSNRVDRIWLTASLTAAVVTFIPIAVLLAGEERYLSPVYPWLWVVAGAGLVVLAETVPRNLGPIAGVAVVAALMVSGAHTGGEVNAFAKENFTQIKIAAQKIRSDAAGRSCGVVTGFLPQVQWYSRCTVRAFPRRADELPGTSIRKADAIYLVFVQEGKRQPSGEERDGFETASSHAFTVEGKRIVDVWSWRDR